VGSADRSDDDAALIAVVEEAKRELLTAVPSPRGIPGRHLAEALLGFEERLREAADLIRGRTYPPASEDELASAIGESLRRAERLRLEAPALDYEGLVGTLADLIEPLDAFVD
jgi:hypothetical protein